MADKFVSQLPSASGLSTADVVVLNQGGTTKTVPAGNVITAMTGFTQSGTGGTARTPQSKLQDTVSIMDFGADNTGVSDSTTAIQNALNTKKKVYAPAGVYLFSTLTFPAGLSNNTCLQGDGTTDGTGQGTIFKTTAAANVAFVLSGTASTEDILIRDIHLQGNATNTGGINFGTSSFYVGFTKLHNVTIEGFTKSGGYGIQLGSVQELHCTDCRIRSNDTNILKASGGSVTSTVFDGKAGYCGLATVRGVDLGTNTVQDITFRDIVFEQNGSDAVYSAGNNSFVLIDACFFEVNCKTAGTAHVFMDGGSAANQQGTLIMQNCQFHADADLKVKLKLDHAYNCQIVGNAQILKDGGIVTTANTVAYFGYNNFPNITTVTPETTYNALLGTIRYDDYSPTVGAFISNQWVYGPWSVNGNFVYLQASAKGTAATGNYAMLVQIAGGDLTALNSPTGGAVALRVNNSTVVLADAGKVQLSSKLYPPTDAAATQTAAGIYAGTGAPNNANGSNGDFYFRSDGGASTTVYQKRTGTWTGVV